MLARTANRARRTFGQVGSKNTRNLGIVLGLRLNKRLSSLVALLLLLFKSSLLFFGFARLRTRLLVLTFRQVKRRQALLGRCLLRLNAL